MNEIAAVIVACLDLVDRIYKAVEQLGGTREELSVLVARARAERRARLEADRNEEMAHLKKDG